MYSLDSDVCPALIYYILYIGSSFCLYGHGIFVFCSMYYNTNKYVTIAIFMSECIKYCIFTKGIIVIVIVRELDLHLPMQ